jgi:hypothetical protein
VGELIAGADNEVVEGVLRIELRRSVPVEALLGDGPGRGPLAGGRRLMMCLGASVCFWLVLFLFGDEFYVAKLQAEVLDSLADQVTVALADVAELRIRNSNEKNRPLSVIVARGLQSGFVRGSIYFFFQCVENTHPRIGRTNTKGRHKIAVLRGEWPLSKTDLNKRETEPS